MYDKLISRAMDYLYQYGNAKEESREIYQYGLEIIIMYIINAGTILLLGIIVGHFLETLILITGFALLQSFCGGYHAKKHLGCFLYMLIGWGISLLVIPLFTNHSVVLYGLDALSLCSIFLFAPVEHVNFPLSQMKKIRMRKIVRINAILLCCLIGALKLLNVPTEISVALQLSLLLSGISIFSAVIQKKIHQ